MHFFIDIDLQTFRKTGACKIKNKRAFFTFGFASSVFVIILPLLILVVNFARTIRQMWKKTSFQQSAIRNERKQITTLLFSLTLVYIICFIPYVIRLLLVANGYLEDGSKVALIMRQSTISFCLLTTISDPILYALCNKGFRRELAKTGDCSASKKTIASSRV